MEQTIASSSDTNRPAPSPTTYTDKSPTTYTHAQVVGKSLLSHRGRAVQVLDLG